MVSVCGHTARSYPPVLHRLSTSVKVCRVCRVWGVRSWPNPANPADPAGPGRATNVPRGTIPEAPSENAPRKPRTTRKPRTRRQCSTWNNPRRPERRLAPQTPHNRQAPGATRTRKRPANPAKPAGPERDPNPETPRKPRITGRPRAQTCPANPAKPASPGPETCARLGQFPCFLCLRDELRVRAGGPIDKLCIMCYDVRFFEAGNKREAPPALFPS